MLFVTRSAYRSARPLAVAFFLWVLGLGALHAAGPGYTQIEDPAPVEAAQVVEYFWYGCPHCNALQVHIPAWKARLPQGVALKLVPVALRPEWVDHARAFYAAEALGVLDGFHPALFRAIHEEKRDLDDAQSLAAFAAEVADVSAEAFSAAMQSDVVEARILADIDVIQRLGLKTTPTLVIHGRYRITPDSAGGYAAMLAVADRLLAE